MKTLFVTIFEGVESKNILRTGIIKKVLDHNPESRVVLFVKNKERADYYMNEFNDPRIIYEVVKIPKISGLNKIFSSLKFKFLRTETTDLRARLVAEERGILYYYLSITLHRILARPLFVRIFRWLDFHLIKDDYFDTYFNIYRPDLILLANLFEDHEISFLRSAKKYGVRSIGLINSWDRVTARCILRLIPDFFIVFNNNVRDELVQNDVISIDNIFVAGLPQYDSYYLPIYTSKEQVFKKIGISMNDRLIVYSPIGGMFSNSDLEMIDFLYDLNVNGMFGSNVKILVRFPPNDFIKEEELTKRPGLLYQRPGTRFSNKRSQDWDMTNEELEDLRVTLYYMSLIICYPGSIAIDASIFDKPIININFEIKDNGRLSKSPTMFYGMTHYKKALKTGGIKRVYNESELIKWVRAYLDNPSLDTEGRKILRLSQGCYEDGKSSDRIANYLTEKLIN